MSGWVDLFPPFSIPARGAASDLGKAMLLSVPVRFDPATVPKFRKRRTVW